jgi:hypothetical protein
MCRPVEKGLYKVAAGDTSMNELLDLYWPDFGGSSKIDVQDSLQCEG